ncbi:hypothetical protein J2R87_009758 [Bradyrhizobium elkanii]|nr:hypothetical protein [Bradyrhizobium elkanii]MCP1975951.1 hypothetical protein [Bradyrhizobium elkanii]MCP1984835.1 hypothetical protein [Bradyrhizobium elkanii]MCS3890812.1 hypothetical protein [Bradyrhizobium elkanii]MCS4113004.1 hypothetical protein [Bradyrhizobium elkanii]
MKVRWQVKLRRGCHQPAVGESLSSLCVRFVDEPRISRCPI